MLRTPLGKGETGKGKRMETVGTGDREEGSAAVV
jgi:hypothetical protein